MHCSRKQAATGYFLLFLVDKLLNSLYNNNHNN